MALVHLNWHLRNVLTYLLLLHRPCLKKPGPVIFWHNFTKAALISIILAILGI